MTTTATKPTIKLYRPYLREIDRYYRDNGKGGLVAYALDLWDRGKDYEGICAIIAEDTGHRLHVGTFAGNLRRWKKLLGGPHA